MLIERNLERQAREQCQRIQQDNMLLAQDQKAFQKYLNEEVIVNWTLECVSVNCGVIISGNFTFRCTNINLRRLSIRNSIPHRARA